MFTIHVDNLQYTMFTSTGWNYKVNGPVGPANWGSVNPNCDLKSQSPINVYEGDVKHQGVTLNPFTYTGYDTTTNLNLKLSNNGHSGKMQSLIKKIAIMIVKKKLDND